MDEPLLYCFAQQAQLLGKGLEEVDGWYRKSVEAEVGRWVGGWMGRWVGLGRGEEGGLNEVLYVWGWVGGWVG